MDQYFDCPCGHAHHQHIWAGVTEAIGQCGEPCGCWVYHGHRLGDEPHYVIREGLVRPTGDMEADHRVQAALLALRAKKSGPAG